MGPLQPLRMSFFDQFTTYRAYLGLEHLARVFGLKYKKLTLSALFDKDHKVELYPTKDFLEKAKEFYGDEFELPL